MTVLSKFQGCFIGLALGDALCAPYEGGILEGLLWRLIGRTSDGRMRFTDDTQMSLDLARSLTEKGALDQDHIAQSFAHSYRWSRGYGPSAAKLLKRIKAGASWQVENTRQHPQGSYGNGAAMRAPIIALAYNNQPEEMENAVYRASLITHAHPLGIEGARLIAQVVSESIRGRSALEAGKA